MYLDELALTDFRAIASSHVSFVHPAVEGADQLELPNLNVLLGTNGGGKSSVLKAIAAAFRVNAGGDLPGDAAGWLRLGGLENLRVEMGLISTSESPGRGSRSGFTISRSEPRSFELVGTPPEPTFIAAYGPHRAVTELESGSASNMHIFDDSVGLATLERWFDTSHRQSEATEIVNALLPDDVEFLGERRREGVFFAQRGVPLPTGALSDGIRSFLAWLGDLLSRLEASASDGPLGEVEGILLVDEIDQRMHPRWTQSILTRLSATLPALQVICTAHSPLIPGGLRRRNLALVEPDPELIDQGATVVRHLGTEEVYGRTADQVLLSSYFGMVSTRSDLFRSELLTLALRARDRPGGRNAAMELMRRLADPSTDPSGMSDG